MMCLNQMLRRIFTHLADCSPMAADTTSMRTQGADSVRVHCGTSVISLADSIQSGLSDGGGLPEVPEGVESGSGEVDDEAREGASEREAEAARPNGAGDVHESNVEVHGSGEASHQSGEEESKAETKSVGSKSVGTRVGYDGAGFERDDAFAVLEVVVDALANIKVRAPLLRMLIGNSSGVHEPPRSLSVHNILQTRHTCLVC
jgi:hypothetical protein